MWAKWRVKEQEKHTWSPKLLALQWWMPSSTELIRMTGKTGPNGSSQAILISGRTLSNNNGHIRFPSLLYSWQNVAPFSFASTTNPSMKFAEDSDTTGVMSESSSGAPTDSFATLAFTFSTRASATDSITKTTFTAVHLWPLQWQMEQHINHVFSCLYLQFMLRWLCYLPVRETSFHYIRSH